MKKDIDKQTLDAEAVNQVGWYAERFGRDPSDVVNGIVAGGLKRLRERFDEGDECSDATASVLEEDVIAARRRRSA